MGKAIVVALAGTLLLPAAARAEGPMLVSGSLSISFEGGDFGQDVGTGFGFATHGTYSFGDSPFGFHVSGVGTWHETQDRFVAVPVGGQAGQVPSRIETRQHVFTLIGGPQLTRRSGSVRPYAYALAGFAHFSATSKAADGGNFDLGDAAEIQDDVFAWSLGGGVLIPIGQLLRVDLGARYLGSGEAGYPDGSGFFLEGGALRSRGRAKLGQFETTIGLGFSF